MRWGAPRVQRAAGVVGMALACFAAGKLAVLLGAAPGHPPAVWLPAGVALGGVLARGYHLTAGVALGSLVLYLPVFFEAGPGFSVAAALGLAALLAAGAALQAAVGVLLLRRCLGAARWLDEPRDIGLFLLIAGPVVSVVAASVGTATFLGAGMIPAGEVGSRWLVLWIAETTGALLMAPVTVLWAAPSLSPPRDGRRLWVTVPVLLAMMLTVLLFARVSRWDQTRQDSTHRRRADTITAALERGSDHYLEVVQSIADFQQTLGRIDRSAFQRFVRGPLERYRSFRALGWVPHVAAAERQAHEAAARAEGQPDYTVSELTADGPRVPAAARPAHYPLYFFEPAGEPGNRHLVGLDLGSQPRWRLALEQAAERGRQAVTLDTGLLGDGTPTLLVVAPVHLDDPAAEGTARPPTGYAVGICAVGAIVEGALRSAGREGLGLVLREPHATWRRASYATAPPEPRDHPVALTVTTTPRIAGRVWQLDIMATARYLAAERSWQAWLVLTSGVLFVAWLEAFLLVITGRTSKVEQKVAQRTRELEVSNRAVEEQRAELARSNAELASALNAKEILLRELHHRVKNNLQVIASLFSLQARYLTDPRHREIFEDSRNRVFSIALAHEKLYRSKDLARIDFSEYARNLVAHLQSMLGVGAGIALEMEIHPVTLPVETAIPCGLVINELVTNALKHAFPDGRRGTIRVGLREVAPGRWLVAVEDDGVGLPADVTLGKTESLGLDLVSILASQIGGEIEVDRQRGTSFRLTFGGRRRPDA
jgi:two-component sensor histidine kinase/integral membrane sensor domain MASE1